PVMGGKSRNYVAGVLPAGNGSTGAATDFVADADSEAAAITWTPSAVVVGGFFSTINGVPRGLVAALDPVTGAPLPWDPAPQPISQNVWSLGSGTDGSVYVGGDFTSFKTGAGVGFGSFTPPPAATTAPSLTGTPEPGQT